MAQDMISITQILKEVYENTDVQDQLNSDTVGLRRIERTSDGVSHDIGGKYTVFPLRTGRNQGIGSRIESEILPIPGQQGYYSGRINLKYQYGAIQLTGQVFELADKDFQAFANVADREITGIKKDLLKDQNRQFYGDGTGRIATATGVATGQVIPVVSAKYIEVGQVLDLIDGTTLATAVTLVTGPTVKSAGLVVTAVDAVAKTVTVSGAIATVAANDILVRTKSVQREVTGLAKIVSNTGVLYNIDPATQAYWKGVVDSNAGTNRPLSEGLMIFLCDQVRANGGTTTAMFSGLGVRRAYFELLVQQRRFTNTTTFDGGFSGLAFTTDKGDIPFVVDVDCPDNSIYGVNEGEVKLYRDAEWQFMEKDGSMWQRLITSLGRYDAYEAMMFMYWEIGTHQRNTHWLMRDITEG